MLTNWYIRYLQKDNGQWGESHPGEGRRATGKGRWNPIARKLFQSRRWGWIHGCHQNQRWPFHWGWIFSSGKQAKNMITCKNVKAVLNCYRTWNLLLQTRLLISWTAQETPFVTCGRALVLHTWPSTGLTRRTRSSLTLKTKWRIRFTIS